MKTLKGFFQRYQYRGVLQKVYCEANYLLENISFSLRLWKGILIKHGAQFTRTTTRTLAS